VIKETVEEKAEESDEGFRIKKKGRKRKRLVLVFFIFKIKTDVSFF
jgi:hypothetical protein